MAVAQLEERRVVVPDVAGSSPVGHPGFCASMGQAGRSSPKRHGRQLLVVNV